MKGEPHDAATRMYHVVAINERTNLKDYLTATPVTHREGCTILSKQSSHRDVRKQLEDASVKEAADLAMRRAIIEGAVRFDPAAVEQRFGSSHVFPFVGTIYIDV